MFNIPHVKLYGLELEGSIKLGDKFTATAAYVYQKMEADETRYDTGWTYYLPELLPEHKIKFLGRYEVWKDGFVQLSGRFVGERQTQKTDETLDSYFVMDAGLEQKFMLDKVGFTLGAYVTNLLGEEYQEQAGYMMPRQVYGVRLSMDF